MNYTNEFKENRKKQRQQIEILMENTINGIQRYLEIDEINREEETNKLLNSLKDGIISIAQEVGTPVNEEFLNNQLNVIIYKIQNADNENSEQLLSQLTHGLDIYLEAFLQIQDTDDISRKKNYFNTVMNENSEDRKKSDNMRRMLIDEFVSETFSNTMRRIWNSGIGDKQIENISDKFKYEIAKLRNENINELDEFYLSSDEQLFKKINADLEELFIKVSKIIGKETKRDSSTPDNVDKKWWELTPEQQAMINDEIALKAVKKTKDNNTRDNNSSNDLSPDIII